MRRFRMRAGPASILLAGILLAPQAGWTAGISTSFVGVLISDVPLGRPQPMTDRRGHGIVVNNLGEETLRVRIDVLIPTASQLRPGALPIPDPRWITITPLAGELPGHGAIAFDVVLTVPQDNKYRGAYYQAMIWIRGTPTRAKGVTVSGGLLTRVRFKTATR